MVIVCVITILLSLRLFLRALRGKGRFLKYITLTLSSAVLILYCVLLAACVFDRAEENAVFNVICGSYENSDRGGSIIIIENDETGERLYGFGGIVYDSEKLAENSMTVTYIKHLSLITNIKRPVGSFYINLYSGWIYFGLPLIVIVCFSAIYRVIMGIAYSIAFRYKWDFYQGTYGSGIDAIKTAQRGITHKDYGIMPKEEYK